MNENLLFGIIESIMQIFGITIYSNTSLLFQICPIKFVMNETIKRLPLELFGAVREFYARLLVLKEGGEQTR